MPIAAGIVRVVRVVRPLVVMAVAGALVALPVSAGAVDGLPYTIDAYDFPAVEETEDISLVAGQLKGQPFKAARTDDLKSVSLPVTGVQPNTTLTVELQEDEGFPGAPGASLASGSQAVVEDGTVTFDLSGSGASLTKGNGYVLLVGASSGQAWLVVDDNTDTGVMGHSSYFAGNWSYIAGRAMVARVTVGGLDADAPTASGSFLPPDPDGNDGWYVTNPDVLYVCADATTWVVDCPGDGGVEDGVQDLGATVTDFAGNTGSTGPVPVKVDTVAPSLLLLTDREPNGFGWFKSKVVVSAECSDAGSGVAQCPGDITYLGTTTASRDAKDVAGNKTPETLRVKVDFKAPIVKVTNVRDGAVYNRMPRPKCEASDGTTISSSGIRSCEVDVKRLSGTRYAAIAVAKDKAGWTSTARKTFRVRR